MDPEILPGYEPASSEKGSLAPPNHMDGTPAIITFSLPESSSLRGEKASLYRFKSKAFTGNKQAKPQALFTQR